jgi:hypothetical protein
MGNTPRHRVWVFSLLSWATLVVIPTALIAIGWLLGGPGRDSSVPNVFDLFPFAFFFMVPAAIVTFALLVPLAIAADLGLRGRTTRVMNVVVGGTLGFAAFTMFVAGSVWLRFPTPFSPNSMIGDGASFSTLHRIVTAPFTAAILVLFVVSGMLLGLGLRHRAAAVHQSFNTRA